MLSPRSVRTTTQPAQRVAALVRAYKKWLAVNQPLDDQAGFFVEEFREVCRELFPLLSGEARRISKDEDVILDAVEDTLCRNLFRRLNQDPTFAPEKTVGWCILCVRSRIVDQYRRTKRWAECDIDDPEVQHRLPIRSESKEETILDAIDASRRGERQFRHLRNFLGRLRRQLTASEWLAFKRLRKGASIGAVMDELGVSRASFYRYKARIQNAYKRVEAETGSLLGA
jgi:DNA-directed RNA polymerase specialized sigma24 family protein